MLSWFEMKEALYLFLGAGGLALLIGSYASLRSIDCCVQIAGLVMLFTGIGLVLFGLVTYFCRDDWEIWS